MSKDALRAMGQRILAELQEIAFSKHPDMKIAHKLTAMKMLIGVLDSIDFVEKPKERFLTADEALALREKQIAENPEKYKYNFNEVKYGEERFMNEGKNTRKNE